jgi:hypothetical protein
MNKYTFPYSSSSELIFSDILGDPINFTKLFCLLSNNVLKKSSASIIHKNGLFRIEDLNSLIVENIIYSERMREEIIFNNTNTIIYSLSNNRTYFYYDKSNLSLSNIVQ